MVGRGCSDKGGHHLLEGDCEAFRSGEGTDNYCYCSFYLCNVVVEGASGGTRWRAASARLSLLVLGVVLM